MDLKPGLNVVVSDTTTGKTSFMRLLRVLIGSDYDGIIPELQRVPNLSGALLIGDDQVAVVRRLSQTADAPVDLAVGDFAARLPAMRSDRSDRQTYGDWLIDRLGLPSVRVPTAPSKPAEAATTPVSISDYLRYCRLTEKQIDVDVLGSSHFFRDYKRRVAFQIYFGSYDLRTAELQEELRAVEGELRAIETGSSAFDEMLEGTVLANRAQLQSQLDQARKDLDDFRERRTQLPVEVQKDPAVVEVMQQVRELDLHVSDLDGRREGELVGQRQMAELARQLRAQSARLTKAVVAGSQLVDFDFRICPRCGNGVAPDRSAEEECYLCLQVPSQEMSRDDLLVEQVRIEAQIDEAEELEAQHVQAAEEIAAHLEEARGRRTILASKLEQLTGAFVSDKADEIARLAADESRAESAVAQFEEYLALYDKADSARARAEQLRARRSQIEEGLRRLERVDRAAQDRIDHLEGRFSHFVEALEMPEFDEDADPRSAIHRGTYEPIVNGRAVERQSAGMALLTNVAYMLAIHQTTLELDLQIPRLLMIDAISKNLGRGDYDQRRYELIWRQLAEFHDRYADDLQIIVAANDVPDFIEEGDFVRLRLSERDRLVPPPDEDEEKDGSQTSPEEATGGGSPGNEGAKRAAA